MVSTIFESDGSASIIPFSRILCRCGISKELSVTFDYGEDTVLFARIFKIRSYHLSSGLYQMLDNSNFIALPNC